MKRIICCLLLTCGSLMPLQAQTHTDSLYRQARESAFSGYFNEARQLLDSLLLEYSDNYDALFMMALVQAWDEKYDESLRLLTYLDRRYPPGADLKEALVRVYLWAGRHEQALAVAEEALILFPDNDKLRMLRAQVLGASGRYQEAVNELEDLLDRQPDHQEAQLLASQFRMFSQEHALALEHTYSRFSNTFSPWLQTSLSYRRNLSKGVVMGRLTHARMFDRQALQAEIDTYPTFGPKTYAFLNLGASGGGIFPGFRWGAELYRVLPQNWEVSAGMKGLYFEQNPVHVYTAQLGRYYQQYWFSVRGFAAQVGSSTDLTGLLSMRRYLQNEDHFLSLYLGNGSTPLRINTLAEIRRLSAAWAGIDYQHPLKNREWLLRGSLEYQQESYEEIRRTDRISLGIHVQRRF